ncbi:hypothetical protein, partial [Streptomyces sp. NPDC060022]|uniref:hypothetical protein n=1 Tax=Streptomyces sp. NPDC060022 TaxID=3347039 RepID=UPI00367B8B8B
LRGDGTHLYEAADALLVRTGPPAPSHLRPDLRLPHHQEYFAHEAWFTPQVSGDGTIPRGLWKALDKGYDYLLRNGRVRPVPSSSNPSIPKASWEARQNALLAWTQRHKGSPLDTLYPGHLIALYLLGSPQDARLLDPALTNGTSPAEAKARLRREMRSAIDLAFTGNADFPALLMRDKRFRDTVRALRATTHGIPDYADRAAELDGALVARADAMLERVYRELDQHRGMAAEALDRLRPMGTEVYLTLRGPGTLAAGALTGTLDRITVPEFSSGRFTERAAIAAMEPTSSAGDSHPMLVKVLNSSARDVSLFSRNPHRGEARYSEEAVLKVLHREVRNDEELRRRYEYVEVEEIQRIPRAGDTGPLSAQPGTAPEDAATAWWGTETLDASEMPDSGQWNTGPA